MVIHTHKILKREHNLMHDEQVQTRTQTWTNKHTRIRSQEEERAGSQGEMGGRIVMAEVGGPAPLHRTHERLVRVGGLDQLAPAVPAAL